MVRAVWKTQLKTREIVVTSVTFAVVAAVYGLFDVMAHGSYALMRETLSPGAFAAHVSANVLLALTTTAMVSAARINLKLAGFEPRGSTAVPALSVVFALFTFACTPCVIAFLAAVGLAFTPLVLPHGNVLWKFVLLALLLIALAYMLWRIAKGTCKPGRP